MSLNVRTRKRASLKAMCVLVAVWLNAVPNGRLGEPTDFIRERESDVRQGF